MIILQNIEKIYTKSACSTKALTNVSLQIKSGEFVAIVGQSGSGKSTLLNILGCMDMPTAGSYYFDEVDVLQKRYKELAGFRNKEIGFIFQSFNLVNDLTALENVEMPLGYAGVKKAIRREKAESMLEKVGLSDKIKSFPKELSGGQQQRVAIARALINEPSLILADEPTGNLDTKTSHEIISLFHEIHQSSKEQTIIMITHNNELTKNCDRVLHVEDGIIIY